MELSNIAQVQRQALSIQLLESQHEVSLASEEIIHKEEDSRRLRVCLLVQEEANDDLQDRLAITNDRIYELEETRSNLQAQLEQVEGVAQQIEADLRAKGREIDTLKVSKTAPNINRYSTNALQTELTSMNGLSKDSNKLLAEKLELSRELASIKPELDHLRSQAAFQQKFLSEKLSLQRQLSTVELELEAAKSAALKQEIAKGTISKKEAELQKQVETLKEELAQEQQKREQMQEDAAQELESAKEEAFKQAEKISTSKKEARLEKQMDELRKELAQEKEEREQAQVEAERELAAARKDASKQASNAAAFKKDAEFEKQLEDLKSEVVREKKRTKQAQSAAERDAREWESKRTILEGKVEAMRMKLRATKEELKEVQASLAQTIAQASKTSVTIDLPEPQNKSRKRSALSILDNTIGTPDGIAVRGKRPGQKRGKLDQTSLGEKSMFSITPYLNKTANVLLETPRADEEPVADAEEEMQVPAQDDDREDEEQAPFAEEDADAAASPSVSRVRAETKTSKKPADKKPKAPSKKGVTAAKKSAKIALEQVEEGPEADEPPASSESKAAPAAAATKPLLNVPKLTAEVAEPKKKRRKILSTVNKTIFDEEDAEATKRPAKMLLATNKPLARLAGKKNLSSAPAAQFGAFSPLKKDKRGVQASFLG